MGKSTGKPSAPVDTMSVMRKLEPIYELIDAGNNKGALQAIDRDLLRKYPALQIGRVLKGIVLGRLGRFDEGRELCESVRAEGPSDDTVLNTLALYYRQNDMRAELIGAFESASERQPRNVEYLKTLFSAYARDYVHVKQQQCAMKLYRLTNDPKHITWAVCAMLVQSRDVPSLIRVAAAACAKLRDAGAVRDRETLLVCARVFREAGDIDASLALLDGPIGDACLPMLAERASLRAATASLAGYKDVAAARWREVLAVAPDDWAAMRAAMDIAVPGTRAGNGGTAPPLPGGSWPSPGAHSVDGAGEGGEAGESPASPSSPASPASSPSSPADVSAGGALARELRAAADAAGGARVAGRGPYLLAVEAAWRAFAAEANERAAGGAAGEAAEPPRSRPDSQELESNASLAGAALAYWREFGAWTSCARDLRPYVEALRRRDFRAARSLARRLAEEADEARADGGDDSNQSNQSDQSDPSNRSDHDPDRRRAASIRRLRRAVAAASVRADLGAFGGSWRDVPSKGTTPAGLSRPSAAPAVGATAAADLMHRYRAARALVAGGDPREPTPADVFALLAARALAAEASEHAAGGAAGKAAEPPRSRPDSDHPRSSVLAALTLMASAAVAEEALASSPNHAEIRLGLVSAYALLGAPNASRDAFLPLDCKNIQMDTMVHHALPAAEGGAEASFATHLCDLADRLRADAAKDIGTNVARAYENGAHTKALEFVSFRERLRDSHASAAMRGVRARANLRRASAETVEANGAGGVAPAVAAALAEGAAAFDPLPDAAEGMWPPRERVGVAYNEDLATNPAWNPPHHGRAALAAADWHASRRVVVPAGGLDEDEDESRTVPPTFAAAPRAGASDAGVGEGSSVAHRAGWSRALRRRALEFRAARAAAALSSPRAGPRADAAEASAVANLVALFAEEDVHPGAACARTLAPASAAADAVSDAILAALASLVGTHHATPDDDDAAIAKIAAFADATANACAAAAEALVGGAALTGDTTAGDGLAGDDHRAATVIRAASNGAVPSAFHAVCDVGVLAEVTASAWAGATRAAGTAANSTANSAGNSTGVAGNPALVAAVRRAARVVADAIGSVADAAERVIAMSEGAAEMVARAVERRAAGAAGPEHCAAAAGKIIDAHRAALGAVVEHAERIRARLHSIADAAR